MKSADSSFRQQLGDLFLSRLLGQTIRGERPPGFRNRQNYLYQFSSQMLIIFKNNVLGNLWGYPHSVPQMEGSKELDQHKISQQLPNTRKLIRSYMNPPFNKDWEGPWTMTLFCQESHDIFFIKKANVLCEIKKNVCF